MTELSDLDRSLIQIMSKSAGENPPKKSWLVIFSATVFGAAILATSVFYIYESQLYGRVANSFPKEKLDAMMDRTGEEIDAQSAAEGYRSLNNPFFGAHALAIDAPRGAWLVSFDFDENGKAKGYSVMYSNANSLMYHNRTVKKKTEQ